MLKSKLLLVFLVVFFFACFFNISLQIAADDLTGRVEQNGINHSEASSTPRVTGQACMQL